MRRDLLGLFDYIAVLEVSGYTSGAPGVTTGGVGETSGCGPALDHAEHIHAGHRIFRQPAPDRVKPRGKGAAAERVVDGGKV